MTLLDVLRDTAFHAKYRGAPNHARHCAIAVRALRRDARGKTKLSYSYVSFIQVLQISDVTYP